MALLGVCRHQLHELSLGFGPDLESAATGRLNVQWKSTKKRPPCVTVVTSVPEPSGTSRTNCCASFSSSQFSTSSGWRSRSGSVTAQRGESGATFSR